MASGIRWCRCQPSVRAESALRRPSPSRSTCVRRLRLRRASVPQRHAAAQALSTGCHGRSRSPRFLGLSPAIGSAKLCVAITSRDPKRRTIGSTRIPLAPLLSAERFAELAEAVPGRPPSVFASSRWSWKPVPAKSARVPANRSFSCSPVQLSVHQLRCLEHSSSLTNLGAASSHRASSIRCPWRTARRPACLE
jgi:hypothetical protein